MKKQFIYERIYNDIRRKIETRELKNGERLPVELDIVKQYGASRDTVRKALARLKQEKLIIRIAGKGTYVRFPQTDYNLTKLRSFTEIIKQRDMEPSSSLLSIHIHKNPIAWVKEVLNLDYEDSAYEIIRIRKANGVSMAYEITWIPQKIGPALQTHLVENFSFYQIYEKDYSLSIDYGEIKLEAEQSPPEVAKALGINTHSCVLKMNATIYLTDNRPLYHTLCYYIGEKYVFSTILQR